MSYVPVGSRAGGAWEFLETVTISSQAVVDLDLTGTYQTYVVHIDNLVPATDATEYLQMRFSTDGGTIFLDANLDYSWGLVYNATAVSDRNSNDSTPTADDTAIPLSSDAVHFLGTATAESLNGFVYLHNCRQATNAVILTTDIAYVNSSGVHVTVNTNGGLIANIGSVDAVRLLASSGNLTSGRVSLYGVLTA
jgi:hypothetical protein